MKIVLDEQPHGWKNNLVRYIKRADGLGKQCKEMGMRILIIEDDKELSYEIKEGLEKKGFAVDVANLGMDGEEKAFVTDYEAVLLDLNLPDKDGLEILRFFRAEDRNVPVLIISARDALQDITCGLDSGADDYIVKPFDFEELASRIHAVVRRLYGRTSALIRIGELEVNPLQRLALYGGQPIPLSAKEFDILCYMVQRGTGIISSEEIAEHIYDEFYNPFSSVLRVHIANLRRKLKEASGRDLLVTWKGKGYQICVL